MNHLGMALTNRIHEKSITSTTSISDTLNAYNDVKNTSATLCCCNQISHTRIGLGRSENQRVFSEMIDMNLTFIVSVPEHSLCVTKEAEKYFSTSQRVVCSHVSGK